MKSRSSTVYVVLALAALALWFARPAGKIGESSRATPTASASPATTGYDSGPVPTPDRPTPTTAAGSTPLPASTTAKMAGPITAPGSPPTTGETDLLPDQRAQVDVGKVRHMVSDYHTLMGENPVGTNAEIMKQLMGGNSHQATLGPPEGMSLNAQGELIDQWGTPIFFHQLSRDKMEVRSAGPDRIMWTADDVATR